MTESDWFVHESVDSIRSYLQPENENTTENSASRLTTEIQASTNAREEPSSPDLVGEFSLAGEEESAPADHEGEFFSSAIQFKISGQLLTIEGDPIEGELEFPGVGSCTSLAAPVKRLMNFILKFSQDPLVNSDLKRATRALSSLARKDVAELLVVITFRDAREKSRQALGEILRSSIRPNHPLYGAVNEKMKKFPDSGSLTRPLKRQANRKDMVRMSRSKQDAGPALDPFDADIRIFKAKAEGIECNFPESLGKTLFGLYTDKKFNELHTTFTQELDKVIDIAAEPEPKWIWLQVGGEVGSNNLECVLWSETYACQGKPCFSGFAVGALADMIKACLKEYLGVCWQTECRFHDCKRQLSNEFRQTLRKALIEDSKSHSNMAVTFFLDESSDQSILQASMKKPAAGKNIKNSARIQVAHCFSIFLFLSP